MSAVSRGFRGLRRAPAGKEGRVPPGQYVTDGFPVLSAGPTPHTPLREWTFSITQGGQTKKSWSWQGFRALPAETVTAGIHCVTRWSKLGTRWRGVPDKPHEEPVSMSGEHSMSMQGEPTRGVHADVEPVARRDHVDAGQATRGVERDR